MFVSFEAPASELITANVAYGCIGLDFNEDHIAACEIDLHGNAKHFERLEYGSIDTTGAGHREAMLSDGLTSLVQRAAARRLPIVCEDLDFQDLKVRTALEHNSPSRRRKLSGLLYARFLNLLARKCEQAGVQLIQVDPAYTSLIGRVKYADPLGVGVHLAAALVVARRGQGCREQLPKPGHRVMSGIALAEPFEVPARKASKSARQCWGAIHAAYGKHRLAAYRQAVAAPSAAARLVSGTRGSARADSKSAPSRGSC